MVVQPCWWLFLVWSGRAGLCRALCRHLIQMLNTQSTETIEDRWLLSLFFFFFTFFWWVCYKGDIVLSPVSFLRVILMYWSDGHFQHCKHCTRECLLVFSLVLSLLQVCSSAISQKYKGTHSDSNVFWLYKTKASVVFRNLNFWYGKKSLCVYFSIFQRLICWLDISDWCIWYKNFVVFF